MNKICFFMETPFTKGGEQRVVSIISNLLVQKGYDVSILCTDLITKEDYNLYNLSKKVKIKYVEGYNRRRYVELSKIRTKMYSYNLRTGRFKHSLLLQKIMNCDPFTRRNTLVKYSKPFLERYIGHAMIMDENDANRILAPKLRDDMTTTDVLKPYYDKVKDKDEITKKMYLDMHFWLPKDILLKADKMSMANSLELRVPFLDKEVWSVASKIPTKYLVKDKMTKEIFRSVAKEVMPKEWYEREKLGFPVPFSKWIKEDKYYKMVKTEFNRNYVGKFFDKEYINKLLEDHLSGKAEYNGRKIFNIYIFLIWYRVYFVEN